jgi:hypothetical protein
VYPPALRDWPPLASFRKWLYDELDQSLADVSAFAKQHTAHVAPARAAPRKRSQRRRAAAAAEAR